DGSTGLLEHALGGGCIPFRSRPEAHIEIGLGGGDAQELQRGAKRDDLVHADALKHAEQARIAVRAAAGNHQRLCAPARAASPWRGIATRHPRTTALPGPGNHAADRHLDDTEHAALAIDEGYVDGELAIALDELAGAVEW